MICFRLDLFSLIVSKTVVSLWLTGTHLWVPLLYNTLYIDLIYSNFENILFCYKEFTKNLQLKTIYFETRTRASNSLCVAFSFYKAKYKALGLKASPRASTGFWQRPPAKASPLSFAKVFRSSFVAKILHLAAGFIRKKIFLVLILRSTLYIKKVP